MYLLIIGLKLLKGILKSVWSKFNDCFAFFVSFLGVMNANMVWDPAKDYSF